MIGEHGPGLNLPAMMTRNLQELSFEQRQSVGPGKKWQPLEGASGDHVNAVAGQLVDGGMRPRFLE
jgi:hypothetical protein